MRHDCEIAVIGGGLVGLATARRLARLGRRVLLLEAEDRLAAHQSGRNSGVVHSGIYYAPGSLKAKLCRRGAESLLRYCARRGIPHERCGKLIVAAEEGERGRLSEVARRGAENGLEGLRRLSGAELRVREPHAGGVEALLVPQTGIVDFSRVAAALAGDLKEAGGEVLTGHRVRGLRRGGPPLELETGGGTVTCRFLVACAGLQSDRVARACGVDPKLRIVPFRGEYYELLPGRRELVRHLIYPVPDPRLPFLGPHLTRTVAGPVEAGPNAVLALRREGYGRWSFSPRDALEMLLYPGTWRLGRAFWRTGLGELRRSLSRRAFAGALRRLVPALRAADLRRGAAGVRAQAVEPSGVLVDDFRFAAGERMLHVLNAPSPAATAALAIAETIADRLPPSLPR